MPIGLLFKFHMVKSIQFINSLLFLLLDIEFLTVFVSKVCIFDLRLLLFFKFCVKFLRSLCCIKNFYWR